MGPTNLVQLQPLIALEPWHAVAEICCATIAALWACESAPKARHSSAQASGLGCGPQTYSAAPKGATYRIRVDD